ncbi:MAG: hypothetical protein ACNA8W_07755, partial [Bradymonadaceae bacterium]
YVFGHSQGGITGPPAVAFEPMVSGVVYSGAGGLLIESLLHKTSPVDIAGAVDREGVRVWDWRGDDGTDQLLRVSAGELAGKWYADRFPGAEFVLPLDAAGELESVYSRTTSGLYLHGFASATENPDSGQTLVVYEDPVTTLRFPVENGQTWVSVGRARNSKIYDLPYAGRDTYEIEVDATGELWLPEIAFDQVLRVRTHLTTQPAAGESTSRRQVSFLFECFGEVARATSLEGEREKNFGRASEVRRLGID